MPAALLVGLGTKLAAMADVVGSAFLARATHESGETQLLVALAGVPEPARASVAAAVAEAVRIANDAAALDVLFVDAGTPLFAAAASKSLLTGVEFASCPGFPILIGRSACQ